jgi:hypothetical protein
VLALRPYRVIGIARPLRAGCPGKLSVSFAGS